MLIIILVTMVLMIVFVLQQVRKYKKEVSGQIVKQHQWMGIIDSFKQASRTIKNADQLEHYLTSIKDQVNNYQTDYNFLIAFNSTIKEVRDRLKQYG